MNLHQSCHVSALKTNLVLRSMLLSEKNPVLPFSSSNACLQSTHNYSQIRETYKKTKGLLKNGVRICLCLNPGITFFFLFMVQICNITA